MRDSTIRLHEVLTPLMIDEINEIYNFREELNKVCSSQVACMTYVHNIFSRQEEINEIREKIQRLLRDLKSLRLEDERFKNYEAFLEDIINSICNLPYSSKGGECELLSEIDQMKEEYAEIIKVIDVLLAEDVKGSIMSEEGLMKEVLSFKIEDLIDVLDKTSFLIDAECGGKLCEEAFPLRELVSGKMNPLKEMIEEPKGFCEKYGLKIVCEEYKDILDNVKSILYDVEKSKVFYSLLYLNWLTSRFKTLINSIQLPLDVDIKVRMKAELERITCITSKTV